VRLAIAKKKEKKGRKERREGWRVRYTPEGYMVRSEFGVGVRFDGAKTPYD